MFRAPTFRWNHLYQSSTNKNIEIRFIISCVLVFYNNLVAAMVTTQTSTTRTPYNHAFPSAISGLENLRLEAKQCGLDHLWNDFESRIPDLFVDDTTESRVGKVIDGRDHIIWATNRDKLLDTLGKGISETL